MLSWFTAVGAVDVFATSPVGVYEHLRDRKTYLLPYRSRWTICALDLRGNLLGPSAQ
jgi:hypothetical protein